ncbi:hypothetical protein RJG79_01745 [Mycoplasmatota bacterium WC44]
MDIQYLYMLLILISILIILLLIFKSRKIKIKIEKCDKITPKEKSLIESKDLYYKWNEEFHIIRINGKLEGLIETDYAEFEKSFLIIFFEVINKGKGKGTIIVNWLINDLKDEKRVDYIELNADNNSESFWKKFGFVSDNSPEKNMSLNVK